MVRENKADSIYGAHDIIILLLFSIYLFIPIVFRAPASYLQQIVLERNFHQAYKGICFVLCSSSPSDFDAVLSRPGQIWLVRPYT